MGDRPSFEFDLDPNRCEAVSPSGRRCQLWRVHDGPHAIAWSEERCPRPKGWPFSFHHWWTLWDDEREWTVDPEDWAGVPREKRLRWCCAFRND